MHNSVHMHARYGDKIPRCVVRTRVWLVEVCLWFVVTRSGGLCV